MAITVKKELPKLFCTVLREFKSDGVTPIWEVNKTLQNRLENLLEKQPLLLTEDACTVHWIDLYRDRERPKPQIKLVESFLCYYLQQIAYQVANKTYNSAVIGMSRTETGTYKKDELFAIATAKIPKIIQNFNPNAISEFTASSGSRLGVYAYQVFRNAVRAAISLKQIDRLSDWGLLVYGVTPSYLVKVLKAQGMDDLEIKYHRLILQSFQQAHRIAGLAQFSPISKDEAVSIDLTRARFETEWKRSSRSPAPDEQQLQEIIKCYNQVRQDRPQYQELPLLPANSGNLVLECLHQCAQAVRVAKQEPPVVSLNYLKQEDTELGDLIPDLQTHSPISGVTKDEFLTVLSRQVAELSPQWQAAMKLIYGQGLRQAAVASQLQVDQYTVSRWQNGNRGKGGWLRTIQEKLTAYYASSLLLTREFLNQATRIELLEYYLELLYSSNCDLAYWNDTEDSQLVLPNKLLQQEYTELGDLIPCTETHSPIVAVSQNDEFAPDPLAKAKERGQNYRQKSMKESLSSNNVMDILKISAEELDELRRSNQIVFLSDENRYIYPKCQFSENKIIDGIDRVIMALPIKDGWTQLIFLESVDPDLNGDIPIDRLRKGDISSVLLSAGNYGRQRPS